MTAKVIQGSFLAGQPKLPPPIPARLPPPIQARTVARPPGPPAPAFGERPPGPPAPAFAARPSGPPAPAFAGRPAAVQRHGSGGACAVEAGQVGLLSSGGRPLPETVRGKMEAALGADFSNVRVYVGPQAERIGAIAFTIGSDIYFAPGRYQPDTVHGQQLLGHELAHVVQQRAGRVKNPLGSGIAVVQDQALEAEADRLGRDAASARKPVQRKPDSGAKAWPPHAQITAADDATGSRALGRYAAVQRMKRGKPDDDSDFVPPQGKKQKRWAFNQQTVETVVRDTGHARTNVNQLYGNIYTCPGCRRPIAYDDLATRNLKLVRRDFTSKSGKLHKQRALEIDHYPTWAPRERALKSVGASDAQIRADHDDPTKLRALCRVCNGKHIFEKKKSVDYDSDPDEEGYHTPDDEPENKGFYAPFRFDPPPPSGGAGIAT